jgi:tetratricopeptide (TPR) repeat protein
MPGQEQARNEISGGIFFSTVIQGRDITVQLPPQVTPALSGLPAASPSFTGRDADMAALVEMLAPRVTGGQGSSGQGTGPCVALVSGLAGVGKTELAVQAAGIVQERGWYAGGALFVDVFGYDTNRIVSPAAALEGFLRALGIPSEHIPAEEQDRARLYASVLSAYAAEGCPILVVIDNASDHGHVKPLLPRDSGCGAIVTSRDTLGMLKGRVLELDVLTGDSSIEMLDRAIRVARPSDRRIAQHTDDAAEIARLCGGLPLALQIIAALLAEDPARPLTAMAAALRSEQRRLDELRYSDIAVRAAFELSYRRLPPDIAWLFRMLPVNPGVDMSTQAATELTLEDQATVRQQLEALARAHLIEHGVGYGRWRLHDLVRLYAMEQMPESDQDDRTWALTQLLAYYLRTTKTASAYLDARNTDPTSEEFPDREQALAWLDAEYPNLVAAAFAAARDGGHARLALDLPMKLSQIVQERRTWTDWVSLCESGLRAARALGDLNGESQALRFLSNALVELRRFDDALAAAQDALAISRGLGDQDSEGLSLLCVAQVLGKVRRNKEAAATAREALSLFQEVGDRYFEGSALSDLGSYLELLGQHDEAISVSREAVRNRREFGDGDAEASGLTNIGIALAELKRFNEAVDEYQAALQIYRQLGNRHGEGVVLNALGYCLREAGRISESVDACREAVPIFRATGDQHGLGMALRTLGDALVEAKRFDAAVEAYRDGSRAYRETGDAYLEAHTLLSLGDTLRDAGRFDEAVAACQQAVDAFRELGERDDEQMALLHLRDAMRQLRSGSAARNLAHVLLLSLRRPGAPQLDGVTQGDLLAAEASSSAAGAAKRRAAAEKLAGLGDPRGADALAVLAVDEAASDFERKQALKCLAKLGDQRAPAIRADQLAATAARPDGSVYSRRNAAEELAALGDARGCDELAVLALHPKANAYSRRDSAIMLSRSGDSRGADLLADMAADMSARPVDRRLAARALIKLGDERGGQLLAAVRDSGD